MTKGPRRLVLDQYLDTASEGQLTSGGFDWKGKARNLKTLGDALKRAAVQAELRIGEQTLTGPALRAGMEKSATSLQTKSEQLQAAGEALVQVGRQISDTRDARDAFADLGEKPPVYRAPAGTPGVEPTEDELAAQAAASQARQTERNNWQDAFDQQEAAARRLTQQLDAAFLEAIPPMKEIHGQADPTEPPPNVPSGPGGTYLPGTQAPPVTGGGGDDTPHVGVGGPHQTGDDDIPYVITEPTPIGGGHQTEVNPQTHPLDPTYTHPQLPTTTVTGTEQTGVTYQPTGPQVSTPTGGSAGPSAGALGAAGAAGGAGGLAAGAVRGANAPLSATRGATPVRAIGSTGRAASAGALTRPTGSSAAAARGAAVGSTAGRTGSAGSSARGAAAGSTAGRGAANGRGAGGAGSRGAAGGTAGSRSGSRGAAGSAAGGRGGRKGERKDAGRDSLVYDQDWLGDDDVAPGVLD